MVQKLCEQLIVRCNYLKKKLEERENLEGDDLEDIDELIYDTIGIIKAMISLVYKTVSSDANLDSAFFQGELNDVLPVEINNPIVEEVEKHGNAKTKKCYKA